MSSSPSAMRDEVEMPSVSDDNILVISADELDTLQDLLLSDTGGAEVAL